MSFLSFADNLLCNKQRHCIGELSTFFFMRASLCLYDLQITMNRREHDCGLYLCELIYMTIF